MAKAKKNPKPQKKPRTPMDPQRAARLRRIGYQATLIGLFIGTLAVAFFTAQRYVKREIAFTPAPPSVVLKNRPAWMSDFLAEQITRSVRPMGAHSSFDHQLLVDVTHLLRTNPWIREVRQVRRGYDRKPGDTIEIDCDYRAPVALVRWKDYFWLVDGEGVKLPEQFTLDHLPRIVFGADGKMNIRVIDGVAHAPVETGRKWPGEDLAAGLDLVKLLYGQPYAEEVVKVDVSNYGGRLDVKEAQLVLGTRYDTQIRWGRPINARDFFVEVSTARKLEYLRLAHLRYGRVDGGMPWIDIRFDKVTYPSDAAVSARGQ